MDNSLNRLHRVFFYGLYMDPDILRDKGVEPRNPEKARVAGYRLRVGKMATLLRDDDASAHGMVYRLTYPEIESLYWGAGLDAYIAEAVLVETLDGAVSPALCCNLRMPPADDEDNPDYLHRLISVMQKLGLPNPTG